MDQHGGRPPRTRTRPALPAFRLALWAGLAVLCLSARIVAQSPTPTPQPPISDNSFLIEEAYNQERGVVQHINNFTRQRGGDWLYTFTQEWPLAGQRHQLSYTVAAAGISDGATRQTGLGDFAINYRYQLVNRERVAVAPRATLLLPLGDSRRGLGAGAVGYQFDLPVSVTHSAKLVTHWNAGATFTPHAKNAADERADTKSFNLGQSTVWLVKPRFNVFTETVWNASESVISQGQTERDYGLLVNPGVRWAYNFKSGLQIVPGFSFPLGVGPSWGARGVFLYLSFEHPFKHDGEEK